jgi:hypothetical protein
LAAFSALIIFSVAAYGFAVLVLLRRHLSSADAFFGANVCFLNVHAYFLSDLCFLDILYALADPERSLRDLGHNTMDRGILDLKPWFRLNIQESERYRSEHFRFLLYVHAGYLGGQAAPNFSGQVAPNFNWLLSDLAATGRHLELKARQQNQLLFLVK